MVNALNHILGMLIWHTLATLVLTFTAWSCGIVKDENPADDFTTAYAACGVMVIVLFLTFWSVRFIFGAMSGETFYSIAMECIGVIRNIKAW